MAFMKINHIVLLIRRRGKKSCAKFKGNLKCVDKAVENVKEDLFHQEFHNLQFVW